MEQFYRNLQQSPQMNYYRRQLAATSMAGQPQLLPNLNAANGSLPNSSAAFDAWSRIAFLNSNPMAKNQANPLRGLLSVKSNYALGLNRNININIAQNIHLNSTTPPPNNMGRNLIAEKNTRIRNEINRMIYSNSVNSVGVDRYACNKCNRSYRNKNHLYRHVRYECDRKKRYQCGICLKDFYRKDNLKTHISYKHSEYKSSNFILINKEEEVDDELQLDAHNNNNLVISKNELNEMLNKTDNTQQVLSILNNNDNSAESAQKFLHLKLQQEQSNLQRSLLLRIQTENNKITPSQSEVLSKLLSAKSTPVQLNLPSKHLEIFPRPSTPAKLALSIPNKTVKSGKLLATKEEFIDLEDSFNDNDALGYRSNEEDEDEEFVPIEPFVHIDIDSFQDVDANEKVNLDHRTSKNLSSCNTDQKSAQIESKEKSFDTIADTSESNKELKAILSSVNVKNDEIQIEKGKEEKTDVISETSDLTGEVFKDQLEKTDDKTKVENNENAPKIDARELPDSNEDASSSNSKRTEIIEQNDTNLPEGDETVKSNSETNLRIDLKVAQ